MKKILCCLFFCFTFLWIPFSVNADCNTKETLRKRKIANNIAYDVRYEKNIIEDEDMDYEMMYYNIYFTNVFEDMYVFDIDNMLRYYPTDNIAIAQNYSGGKTFHFAIRSESCGLKNLVDFYVTVPLFNPFYDDEVCSNYKTLSVCHKWVKTYRSEEQIKEYIEKYEAEYSSDTITDKNVKGIFEYLFDFVKKYYYIVIPGVIVLGLVGILVYKKIQEKRELF